MNKRALIAMSGGVDSSVTAMLLREAGYACTGVTMRLFSNDDARLAGEYVHDGETRAIDSGCCSLADVEFARRVASQLDMPFYIFDLSADFGREVIERFISGYECGQTPNPCIDCNRYLKFERLLARAAQLDFEVLATGHYARVERDSANGRYILRKAVDDTKDQSYVLYTLTQAQLARLQLPLGELRKAEVRELAAAAGLPNAAKPDSQNICFVPDGDYAGFIERSRGCAYPPGDFLDVGGHVIGQHEGLVHYTLGQRKGLGAWGKPVYVCAIDYAANTVTLGEENALYNSDFTVRALNWVARETALEQPLNCAVKIGYRHSEQAAILEAIDEEHCKVTFDKPQRAITPGQAAVFYEGDVVLGGGTIDYVI